jgi:NAD(P)-dependent dehydrogenase (short-subunit alcohol dehydrogenase family)
MGRTAIVTGGTGGLGAAVVARLLGEGWRVVVPWIAERELERVEERPGLELIQADLFDPESVRQVVDTGGKDGDAPLGGLVNLVGGFAAGGRIHETPIDDFERQFKLNLRATYLMTQAFVSHVLADSPGEGQADAGGEGQADAAIVCVGTRAVRRPFSGAAGYISSKAAVLSFTEAVAVEYRDDGIRCNAILPSVIDTPGNRASMPKADFSHWVKPEEIAGVIAHLLSGDSAPVSGAAIPVYGRA